MIDMELSSAKAVESCVKLKQMAFEIAELKPTLPIPEAEQKIKDLTKKLEQETLKVQKLNKSLQDKKQRLDKRTAQYNELSAQVMDNVQEIDNYIEYIQYLEQKLQQQSHTTVDNLLQDFKAFKMDYPLPVQNGKGPNCTSKVISSDEISSELAIKRLEQEKLEMIKLQHCYQKQIKLLQHENHDLIVAVQELSSKIVALEEQLVKIDDTINNEATHDIIGDNLEPNLIVIKEEDEQSLVNDDVETDRVNVGLHIEEDMCKNEHWISLEDEIRCLKASLEECINEKRSLMAKLQLMKHDMEESSEVRKHLDQEVTTLKSDISNLKRNFKKYNEKVERFKKRNEEFQRDETESVLTMCSTDNQFLLRNSVTQLNQVHSQLGNEENTRARETEQSVLMNALKMENEKLIKKLRDASEQKECYRSQVIELQQEVKHLSSQVTIHEKQRLPSELKKPLQTKEQRRNKSQCSEAEENQVSSLTRDCDFSEQLINGIDNKLNKIHPMEKCLKDDDIHGVRSSQKESPMRILVQSKVNDTNSCYQLENYATPNGKLVNQLHTADNVSGNISSQLMKHKANAKSGSKNRKSRRHSTYDRNREMYTNNVFSGQ
ncbi:uncharacterized protein MAL8P1.12-like isoform X2 [Sabethes cyaneus]|uniref:uncharacterized protein MAL8P1.12-like isoform X2 n=1 Tax=Sabethes cyaneus TaxID=53552 RepID=UPI00237E9679|nr:uncharacterized protein MAL8P1.12-like isoform X2 [Sabethes cyaneus]